MSDKQPPEALTQPPNTPTNIREMLRDIRASMTDGDDNSRLQRVVALIKSNMHATVCSIYLRHNDTLELTATDGLNPNALHSTILRIGEGLVGDIALHVRPLNLADAATHPLFIHRPETNEDPNCAFVGVPILRSGTAIGVLVVQNTTTRNFFDEEVEALQIIAMILSEMLATYATAADTNTAKRRAQTIKGEGLTEGFAIGHIVRHEPRIEVDQFLADDIDAERERLNGAIYVLRRSVDQMLQTKDLSHDGAHLDVLETYRMFANDRGWLRRIHEAIKTGLTAEAATERVMNGIRARLVGKRDQYLRGRLNDFEDLSNRLLRILSGRALLASEEKLPRDAIIVARTMGPAELLDYDRKKLRALILEESALGAHVAIVARALNIPLVGNAHEITEIAHDGHKIIVDAEQSIIHINPTTETIDAYTERKKQRQQLNRKIARIRTLPAITRDGTRIRLDMNAGLSVDVQNLEASGADNIGLFRTELQFMVAAHMPQMAEQRTLYRSVLDMAENRKVVFRTVDIGGDKVLPYMQQHKEENPAMGWRGLRMALDRPGLLRTQIRALLQAAISRELYLMFPLVATIEEFQKAREMFNIEKQRLEKQNIGTPQKIEIGTMLEVPALTWQLDHLLPHIDFLSIGTTDLMQFFFASDRGNPLVGGRYDMLNVGALMMLKHIQQKCANANVPVSICGEQAASPIIAMTLLALGFQQFSLPSTSIGPIKRMLRSINLPDLINAVQNILESNIMAPRPHLYKIADEQGIKL